MICVHDDFGCSSCDRRHYVLGRQASVCVGLNESDGLVVAEEFSIGGLGWWLREVGVVLHGNAYDLFSNGAFLAPKTIFIVLQLVVCEVAHCVVDEHAADGQASVCHIAIRRKRDPLSRPGVKVIGHR